MSESENAEEGTPGIVPTLVCILQELKDAQERVRKLIATERRARRKDEEVVSTLQKVRRTLETVKVDLGEVVVLQGKQREKELTGQKKRDRGEALVAEELERSDGSRMDEEEEEEDVSRDQRKRALQEQEKAL